MSAEQVQAQTETQGQAVQGTNQEANGGATEKVERLSPQFAALARKEKAIRLEAQKIKSEREALTKEREQFKSPGYITKDELRNNPIGILVSNGWSHNQIAEMLLSENGQIKQAESGPTMAQLLARLDEIDSRTKSYDGQFKDWENKEKEYAIDEIRKEAVTLIDSDPEFETIKTLGRIDDVVKRIQEAQETDGTFLSVPDAAKEIEERLLNEAIKLSGLQKLKQRLQPKVEAPPEVPLQKQTTITPKQQPIQTLTHDMTSSTQKQPISAKERVRRAVMVAQGLDPDTGKPRNG